MSGTWHSPMQPSLPRAGTQQPTDRCQSQFGAAVDNIFIPGYGRGDNESASNVHRLWAVGHSKIDKKNERNKLKLLNKSLQQIQFFSRTVPKNSIFFFLFYFLFSFIITRLFNPC